MKKLTAPAILIFILIFAFQNHLQAKKPLSSASGVALEKGSFRSATFSMW